MTKLNHAHADPLARLASLRPSPIRGTADLADAENRADYLKEVFSNVNAFLDAVVTDTVKPSPGISRMNRDKVEVAVWDMVNVDVVNVARKLDLAGCRLSAEVFSKRCRSLGNIRAAA
jgi:hypothetical protein